MPGLGPEPVQFFAPSLRTLKTEEVAESAEPDPPLVLRIKKKETGTEAKESPAIRLPPIREEPPYGGEAPERNRTCSRPEPTPAPYADRHGRHRPAIKIMAKAIIRRPRPLRRK